MLPVSVIVVAKVGVGVKELGGRGPELLVVNVRTLTLQVNVESMNQLRPPLLGKVSVENLDTKATTQAPSIAIEKESESEKNGSKLET